MPPDSPADDSPTPGDLVRAGVTQLMRWTARSQGRREFFGPAAEEMSANDVVLLDFIHHHGPVRLSELASQHGVDKSTMTPQVNRLDSKGLIERHNDPDDARATLVSLSEDGREVQRRIGAAGADLFDEVLAGWSKKDRQALATLLDRFVSELVASHPGDPTT
jgi:DNA-binding MarR family transcriptional regulator